MNREQKATVSLAATGERSFSSWKNRMADWRIYAAAAGSALAMSTNASADTIVHTPINITETRESSTTHTFQIAGNTFKFQNNAFTYFTIIPFASSRVIGKSQYAAGHKITGDFKNTYRAKFGLGTRDFFFGIQLFRSSKAGDLGWIHVQVGPDSATIVDAAYNDSIPVGAPINAGDVGGASPSAVPEPSTAALTLLASGAAGLLAWRKRRAAAKAQ